MTKHHILYPVLAIVIVSVLVFLFYEHEKRKKLELDVAVQETKQQAAKDQQAAIEILRQQQIADLENLRSKPATIQTVTKYLPVPLPSGSQIQIQPATGTQPAQLVVTGDPQANLDAFQKGNIVCAENKVNLDACQKDSEQDKKVIIPSLVKERDDLRKLAIPHWTATLGVSKAQVGGYKPDAFLDYRVQKSWGVTVGASNNALFAGVSIHFGGGVK
jgi:hypothetical protein